MKQLTIALVFVCLALATAFAQSASTATLSGRVVDPSGAVIVGAKVTASQKATGAARDTVTNSDGLYVLPSLPPGEYSVTIEATGFKKTIISSVILPVGQTINRDFSVIVGMLSEVTELIGTPLLVNTLSASVEGVITNQSIATLPLNGRPSQ